MDSAINTSTPAVTPPVDATTLNALLNMGGPELRADLCAQLIADFQRLHRSFPTDDGKAVARAAHEVKGLALTVGAGQLASLALRLEGVAETLPQPALEVMASPLRSEIDAVVSALKMAAQSSAQQ